jgi:HK97 family phage prohead protease
MITQVKDASQALRLAPPLEFKFVAAQQQSGIIEGYATIFGLVDTFGDIVEDGAFEASLAQHKSEGTAPAMLWSHDPAAPIGRWLELVEDETGLRVRGQLNLESDGGQQALIHIKAGDVGGLSIGYLPKRVERAPDNGLSLVEIDLYEVSVVSMPANRRARIISLKQATSLTEFEQQLRSLSYSRADARRLALRAWPKAGEPKTQLDHKAIIDRIATNRAEIKHLIKRR